MDRSPPGSSVHGTSQARILEWVAILSSRGSFPPRDRTCLLHWQVDSLPLSHLGRPVACLFPIYCWIIPIVCIIHFILSSVFQHLGYFWFLAILSNAAIISMYKFLCGYIFFSQIGTYKWNCLATLFNFLRNYQTVFHSICIEFPQTMNENSRCFTFPPVFGVASVLNLGLSNMCVVVSRFSLHFSYVIRCEIFFICSFVICVSSWGTLTLLAYF